MSAPSPLPLSSAGPAQVMRRFVRITAERGPFVEFDFAIGWPELSVELVLPRAAFEEFCQRNAVIFLDPSPEPPAPTPDDEET